MALTSNSYDTFWNYDMKWRRNLLYPPFVKYIKLIIKEHSQVQAEMNTKKNFTSLLKNLPKTIVIKDPFFTQTNKFYLGNIILSYTKQDPRPYLSKLPAEVIIDFDPEEI
jgi:primosomal protein N'